jgi:hypothetical protein
MILFYLILTMLLPGELEEPRKAPDWGSSGRVYRTHYEIGKAEVSITKVYQYCSMSSDCEPLEIETYRYIYNVERRVEKSDGMVFWIHIGIIFEEHLFDPRLTRTDQIRTDFVWLGKKHKGISLSMEEAIEQMLKD